MTTNETIQQLRTLAATSERLWDMAVDTCHDCAGTIDEARQQKCRDAMDRAVAAWDAAIEHAETGDMAAARAELDEARALAAEWGDDATEREALALVQQQTTWYLAPADDLTNEWAAGYDGNTFATREEAEAAIPALLACDPAFADTEWVAVQREVRS